MSKCNIPGKIKYDHIDIHSGSGALGPAQNVLTAKRAGPGCPPLWRKSCRDSGQQPKAYPHPPNACRQAILCSPVFLCVFFHLGILLKSGVGITFWIPIRTQETIMLII